MVAHYYAEKSTIDMQVNLDQKKFNEAQLVSFKLPLNQPYIINTDGYESLEGNMDYNGVNYQFVKKRIINDTLEIVCIPNMTRTEIDNNNENFAKQLSDIVNTSTSKKSGGSQQFKFFISDFTTEHHFDLYSFVANATLKHDTIHAQYSSFDYLQSIAQPPEA
jgi:hypothetical protein